MSNPMISVVMPVYNGEKYLYEAIDSILNQTYTDFEFIILNDGSTDKTEEIILSYDDPRIVYVKNEKNQQIVKTLNKGIALAKGKYIARMDADDISLPDRFSKQIEFMETNPDIEVCGSWIKTFGDKSEVWEYPESHEKIKTAMLFDSSIAHPSVILRATLFSRIQYDEDYNGVEDYALWMKLLDRSKFHNLEKVLLQYRLHTSKTDKIRQKLLAQKVRKELLKRTGVCIDEGTVILEKLSEKIFIEFTELETFFENLLESNSGRNYFNQEELRWKVCELNWQNMNRVERYSLKVLKYFFTTSLDCKQFYPLYNRIIFFIKFIVGYKNENKHTR